MGISNRVYGVLILVTSAFMWFRLLKDGLMPGSFIVDLILVQIIGFAYIFLSYRKIFAELLFAIAQLIPFLLLKDKSSFGLWAPYILLVAYAGLLTWGLVDKTKMKIVLSIYALVSILATVVISAMFVSCSLWCEAF